MGEELGLDGQPGVFPLSDRFAEMGGIPVKGVHDDGGEQVEDGHAKAAIGALATGIRRLAGCGPTQGVRCGRGARARRSARRVSAV